MRKWTSEYGQDVTIKTIVKSIFGEGTENDSSLRDEDTGCIRVMVLFGLL